LPLYFIPFTTELPEVLQVLGNVKICKYAMMAVLQMGKVAWKTCKQAVESGMLPPACMVVKIIEDSLFVGILLELLESESLKNSCP
jgi:hypothetical protein